MSEHGSDFLLSLGYCLRLAINGNVLGPLSLALSLEGRGNKHYSPVRYPDSLRSVRTQIRSPYVGEGIGLGPCSALLRLALNGTVRNHIENWTFPLILAHLSLRSCLCSACSPYVGRGNKFRQRWLRA